MHCAARCGELEPPLVVCAQAGEVNTGAFDDLEAATDAAAAAGAWLHVDGAFGLWAAASPTLAHLARGHARADSWALDGHKWLNVPYDCGIAFCARPDAHRAAMGTAAAYYVLDPDAAREPSDWTPESSRRARSIPVYAAIRQLGRTGVAELVDRCCAHARAIAKGLVRIQGCELLNEVVLNQVLFRFEDEDRTRSILTAVQHGGEAWLGGTTWDGRAAIRLSVSGWRTTEDDVARTVRAFEQAAAAAPLDDGYSSAGASAARSAISVTTAGSASVVVSPSGRFSATSRSSRRMIFPERVFGSSGVKTTFAGFAIAPIFCATWSRSSSSIATEPSSPLFSVT